MTKFLPAKKQILYGAAVCGVYLLLILVSRVLNIVNIDYVSLDFIIDSYKETHSKIYRSPKRIFIVEITDKDVEKYGLHTYYLPRKLLAGFVDKCGKEDVNSIFFDVNLCFGTSENGSLSDADGILIDALNASGAQLYLIECPSGTIDGHLDGGNVDFVNVDVTADKDYTVRKMPSDGLQAYVSYKLYERVGGDTNRLLALRDSPWIDGDMSGRIIFKAFHNAYSYYSGLTRMSYDAFMRSDLHFKDAVILFGRVDAGSKDFFNTAAGVMPGIYVHADTLMSLIHFGLVKSYYVLNALFAFLVGMAYAAFKAYLAASKRAFSELQIEVAVYLLFAGCTLVLVAVSYLLFGLFTLWVDFITVMLAASIVETVEVIVTNVPALFKKTKPKAM